MTSLPRAQRHPRRAPKRWLRRMLALCAVYIVLNETFANWQALWFCAGLLALAVSLLAGAGRARLRISSAAARPARSALCSTSPKPAAASATDISTIDGRTRLSAAARQRHPAEHAVIVERDRRCRKVRAQPGLQAALAGERHRRVLDGEIAQIERLADRQEADDQQPVGLPRGRKEGRLHAQPTMRGAASPGNRATVAERRRRGGGAGLRSGAAWPARRLGRGQRQRLAFERRRPAVALGRRQASCRCALAASTSVQRAGDQPQLDARVLLFSRTADDRMQPIEQAGMWPRSIVSRACAGRRNCSRRRCRRRSPGRPGLGFRLVGSARRPRWPRRLVGAPAAPLAGRLVLAIALRRCRPAAVGGGSVALPSAVGGCAAARSGGAAGLAA